MFDIVSFGKEYGFRTATEHQKSTRGWVQIEHCPSCNSHNYRLGFNPKSRIFHCWKCRILPFWETLLDLSGLTNAELKNVIWKFGKDVEYDEEKAVRKNAHKVVPPPNVRSMDAWHRTYLEGRGYNPDELAFLYKIQGTAHDTIPFWKNRIIIPIYAGGKLVSMQGRAIFENQTPKYFNLPIEDSVVDLKETLYGMYYVIGDKVLVVEGVFDMWRMGFGTVATYGTSYTDAQIKLLLRYKRIFLLYDLDSEEAVESGRRLVNVLKAHGRKAMAINIAFKGDPGDFNQDQVNYIYRTYLGDRHEKTG